MKSMPLDALVFNAELWPRVQQDQRRIEHLADLLRAGVQLPPIKVQKGSAIVLGGWHTAAACRLVGETNYAVETVDVPDNGRLLYAYHEDADAALPYSNDDARSVAQRLYTQRCVDGELPDVKQLAADLGRSRQTVDRWVNNLVEARKLEIEVKRAARVLVVHAFQHAGLKKRQIANLVGVSEMQVRTDAQVGITSHLADSRVVTEAHSLIQLAISRGATVAHVKAADEWLVSQTDPGRLVKRERYRQWEKTASAIRDVREQLERMVIPERTDDWSGIEALREELQQNLAPIKRLLTELEGRLA